MGTRGPVPNRSEERRRRNKPEIETVKVDLSQINDEVEIPEAPEHWHPTATQWYESLAKSGQAKFYEPSDWSTAFVLAEALSRELQPQPVVVPGANGEPGFVEMHKLPIKGASISALLKGFSALMVTEGDRRRLQVELERDRTKAEAAAAAAGVPTISDRRAARAQRSS